MSSVWSWQGEKTAGEEGVWLRQLAQKSSLLEGLWWRERRIDEENVSSWELEQKDEKIIKEGLFSIS